MTVANRFANRHAQRFHRSIALLARALGQSVTAAHLRPTVAAAERDSVTAATQADDSAGTYFRSLPWENAPTLSSKDGESTGGEDVKAGVRLSIVPGRDATATGASAMQLAASAAAGDNIMLAGTLDALRRAERGDFASETADGSSRAFFEGLPWDGAAGSEPSSASENASDNGSDSAFENTSEEE